MPCQGPRGTLAAGATTTVVTLTTVLPAAVGVNQLANRGDGIGFKLRIIGNAAGSSGKTEERHIVNNTGGTTPTITLDSALSFSPILGDAYEFLSGKIYITNTTDFRSYDVATRFLSASLSLLNVTLTSNQNELVPLDELHVPYDRNPGEGFFGILIATASGAASLTGQAAGGDATVLANEYRNFQIRIVEDIAIPTAVGQRHNITSHTAGASSVYTVPAWAVQPSATAKFVIENNGDRILHWNGTNNNTETYTVSTNTWDQNVTFVTRGAALNVGSFSAQSFGIEPDSAKNSRHSFIFIGRGGTGATTTIDLFDIAGAATGVSTLNITYAYPLLFYFGSAGIYEPATNQGRYVYYRLGSGLNDATPKFYRFDMQNRVMEPYTTLRIALSKTDGTAVYRSIGRSLFVDGSTKLAFIYYFAVDTLGTTSVNVALPII